MASLARRVPEEEWNAHKAAIRSLFLCAEKNQSQMVEELARRGFVVTFVLSRPRHT
jgi:hypothetical protein